MRSIEHACLRCETSHAFDSCCWFKGRAFCGAPEEPCCAGGLAPPAPPPVPGPPVVFPINACPGEFCSIAPTERAEYSLRVSCCQGFVEWLPIPTRSDSLPRGY